MDEARFINFLYRTLERWSQDEPRGVKTPFSCQVLQLEKLAFLHSIDSRLKWKMGFELKRVGSGIYRGELTLQFSELSSNYAVLVDNSDLRSLVTLLLRCGRL